MRFWDEMQEPANLQENHKVMLGNPDLVGEDAYQSTSLNRLRGLFGGVEQITTQAELDAWRPESGFAIVTMGVNIDQNIKDIFGLDNNKIEMHSYTIGGTGASAGDTYQQGVSAIDGKTYRRSYNALTGWTDFTVLVDREVFRNRGLFSAFGYGLVSVNDVFYDDNGIAYVCIQDVIYSLGGDNPPLTDELYYKLLTNIDISRKIDFIDWSDLLPAYTATKGQIYRVNGTGGDATSVYWYLCIQDFTGLQSVVDYNDTDYFLAVFNAVPYTGATADVNLGTHAIKLNHVEFNTNPIEPLIIGATYYDAAHKVLATALGDGVIIQNGLEMYVRVVNKNGYNLNDGEVVYISGAHGNRPTATRAIATSEQASYVIGVCTQNIDNNQEGFVTVFGTVNNFNTSTFTDGAKLYLSATTAGSLTMTRPVAPNHGVIVGIALNSTPNGSIFVNPNSGFELNELHDVNTSIEKTIPLDDDYFLVWDTVTSYWKKVTKAYMNEVYVGDSTPTHNEVLVIDTTSINNLSFIANTSSFIVPDFAPVIAKYTSNYASGNTVLVEFPINPPKTNDPLQYLIIKNLKGSDVTFVVNTGDDVVGSITYTYELMQTDSIVVPSGKRVELSYMYMMTSATTCLVSIMYKVQE